ncbi:hypothetical protein ACG02S_08595 [Roseateles sp. DC23W]|uniref:Uncharacterized protein n=1 Tax=Pelomonas dachongensis TaxID=3299029 RepID=A0ABW7EKG9_9BURK
MTTLRDVLRKALLTISLLGVLLFGGGLLVSFAAPLAVEQAAREVICIEVERRVGRKFDGLSNAAWRG